MGKKNSKVAKQKQARKAKQNLVQRQGAKKMGGVAVSKGMNSKFQQAKSPAVLVVGNIPRKIKAQETNSSKTSISPKIQMKNPLRKVFLSPQPTVSGKKKNAQDEQKEFERQMASMQERQLAIDKKKKKSKRKSQKPALEFQPASFSMKKSTQDLLQETVNQMESMSGVGVASSNTTSTPIRTNQSWAVVKDPTDGMNQNNPFAALGDDSDEEDVAKEWDPRIPNFNMAPASFSLLPRTTPTPAPTPCRFGDDDDDDFDPEL